jgi:hypothetical protein
VPPIGAQVTRKEQDGDGNIVWRNLIWTRDRSSSDWSGESNGDAIASQCGASVVPPLRRIGGELDEERDEGSDEVTYA